MCGRRRIDDIDPAFSVNLAHPAFSHAILSGIEVLLCVFFRKRVQIFLGACRTMIHAVPWNMEEAGFEPANS